MLRKKNKKPVVTGNNSRTNPNKSEGSPNFSGQHFLHNKRAVCDLIETAKITKKDVIIEIGAGLGAITLPLAEKARMVIAFENDAAYVQKLIGKVEGESNIKIVHGDFMRGYLPREPFCVVSNIPFSITTPILRKLLEDPSTPLQRAAIILEIGAAKRFTSSVMTNPQLLSWRMRYDMELVQTLPPSYFSPPPKVECCILSIWRKASPEVPCRYGAFFTGLAEWGLRNPKLPFGEAFSTVFTPPQLKHLASRLGIDRDKPVSTLNEREWGVIFQTMLDHVPSYRWPKTSHNQKRKRD
ncbi:23S ribosomal RNA methyltransferase Erm [Paenibacillus piri]|uniref:23S ribosomal RNA methyltransferase Erm n=1 Tax=Paenibacillus piri TaxID=2547395 RepID=UPI001FEA4C03|nr:23S ribosomal RNA methyltransferase Erm [Paenibacillus piri]